MTRQRRSVGGYGQEHVAPTVHTRLGALLVIVGHDKVQGHTVRVALPIGIGDGLGALELLSAGHEGLAIFKRPAVVLRVGQFDVVGLQALGQLQNSLHLIDIVPVQHKVEHHGIAVVFDRPSDLQLLVEGFAGAAQQFVDLPVTGLKAHLDMIQTRGAQLGDAPLGKPHPRSDQIAVIPQTARFYDQFLKVLAQQRLAAGKPQLRGPQLARLAQHPAPDWRVQFLFERGNIQGIGAVGALQGTAVSQLREQPQRRRHSGALS